MINLFIRLYRIDVRRAALPPEAYPSLLEFFVREPHAHVRVDCDNPAAICAPVESTVLAAGTAANDTVIMVKGHHTTLSDLIGEPAAAYHGGEYLGLYLSPADCHRIYAPCDGRIVRTWRLGCTLYPVFPAALARRPSTPVRNQRCVIELAHSRGSLLLIAIGALNVGRIVMPAADMSAAVIRGEELGRFEFGSMVVMVCAHGVARLLPEIAPGQRMRIGDPLALWNHS
jgi:phosphatidylserine decarboxylase